MAYLLVRPNRACTAAADEERLAATFWVTAEGATPGTGIPLVAGGEATSGPAEEGCGDAGCCADEVSALPVVAAALFPEAG